MKEKVICPICGIERQRLVQHLETHNLTKDQFLQMYPGFLLTSEVEQLRMTRLMEENNPMFVKEVASDQARKRQAKLVLKLRTDPVYAAAFAEKDRVASIQLWANRTKEERTKIGNKISDSLAKVNWQKANRSRLCYKFEYNGVVFDSGYAVQFAKFCDKYGIIWQYECIKVKIYGFAKKYRSYTPDFFLPQYGIYVEIKNGYALSLSNVRDKLKVARAILPVLVLSKKFLDYTRDNTEPSGSRNASEGVENRAEDLRIFNTLVVKLHERILNRNKQLGYLILSYDRKICSDLAGDSKKLEIKNFNDNKNVDLEKAHGLNLEDELVKYLGGEVKFDNGRYN